MILKNYKYTDSEIKSLIKSMVILIDTREQEAGHITSQFKKKDIDFNKSVCKPSMG